MTDTEIVIEVAKLDGWLQQGDGFWRRPDGQTVRHHPDYLVSRDAIVPVVEKYFKLLKKTEWERFCRLLTTDFYGTSDHKNMWFDCVTMCLMFSTPRQLCIALLKATGKWKSL